MKAEGKPGEGQRRMAERKLGGRESVSAKLQPRGFYSRSGFSHYAYENSNEFVGFLLEPVECFYGHKTSFVQKVQPISCFLKLLKSAFYFTDEIGVGFGSLSFMVVGSH